MAIKRVETSKERFSPDVRDIVGFPIHNQGQPYKSAELEVFLITEGHPAIRLPDRSVMVLDDDFYSDFILRYRGKNSRGNKLFDAFRSSDRIKQFEQRWPTYVVTLKAYGGQTDHRVSAPDKRTALKYAVLNWCEKQNQNKAQVSRFIAKFGSRDPGFDYDIKDIT